MQGRLTNWGRQFNQPFSTSKRAQRSNLPKSPQLLTYEFLSLSHKCIMAADVRPLAAWPCFVPGPPSPFSLCISHPESAALFTQTVCQEVPNWSQSTTAAGAQLHSEASSNLLPGPAKHSPGHWVTLECISHRQRVIPTWVIREFRQLLLESNKKQCCCQPGREIAMNYTAVFPQKQGRASHAGELQPEALFSSSRDCFLMGLRADNPTKPTFSL